MTFPVLQSELILNGHQAIRTNKPDCIIMEHVRENYLKVYVTLGYHRKLLGAGLTASIVYTPILPRLVAENSLVAYANFLL